MKRNYPTKSIITYDAAYDSFDMFCMFGTILIKLSFIKNYTCTVYGQSTSVPTNCVRMVPHQIDRNGVLSLAS